LGPASGVGGHPVLWPLNKLLDNYDRGTGTTVFKDLHDEMGTKPVAPDLDALSGLPTRRIQITNFPAAPTAGRVFISIGTIASSKPAVGTGCVKPNRICRSPALRLM
jgi:hypothetical protein